MDKWLPKIITLDEHDNDWGKYFSYVYSIFKRDFVDNKPVFNGKRLGLKKHPEYDGKAATFWHMISEGKVESEREPDLRRCERISWPAPIIENFNDDKIRCWTKKIKRDNRILLWLVEEDYLVVLNERKGYILPWTAYLIEYNHTRRKLEKEYNAYKKAKDSTP